MIEFLFDVQSKINSLTHLDPQVIEKKTDRWLFGGATDTRVFLKGHFVKNQKAHPITQQGGTQGEHIQKEGINKQV